MEITFPRSEYVTRYDNSRWRFFSTSSGNTLVLTQRGTEMTRYNPSLRRTILRYKDESDPFFYDPRQVKTFFKAGGNGDVYNVNGTQFLVKESSSGQSLWSALDRMDYLHGISIRHLPPYIKIPDQYGLFISRKQRREYLLMQKINEGTTVVDIDDGTVSVPSGIRDLVLHEFTSLQGKVERAIELERKYHDIPFGNLLPDWDAGNVLVDLESRTKQMPFTFWIIDQ